jgi:hypothetical protein
VVKDGYFPITAKIAGKALSTVGISPVVEAGSKR